MKFLSLSTFLLLNVIAFAQISYGVYPYSTKGENIENIKEVQLITPNLDSLKLEDEITDIYKDIPWRFGAVIFEEIDFFQKANRTVLDDGQLQYQLKITSTDAVSLNFNYSQFDLAEGAKLFIHNGDFSQTLGAFTHQNNPNRIDFATNLTQGNEAIIEVFMPKAIESQSTIKISSIVYGYRSLKDKAANFGSSGNCNIDVNCADGDKWQNEKRSVVLILRSNNSRYCTGALINNVRQDSTPYILTANHCGLDPSSSVFIFNYESASCSPRTDGFTNQSMVGSTFRATNFKSDFTLFELFTTPPTSYNVYYSGWDATGNTPKTGTGIHHPRGDVKKISHDFDTLQSDQYSGATTPNGHWEVTDWDKGTTEPVSSGSPLYNERHRIVGQLHGGQAACGNDRPDFYGKFSNSWDFDSPASQQLKRWLDPDTTNTLILDGLDPNVAAFNTDLEIWGFDGNYSIQCGTQNSPSLLIANRGNNLVTSFQIGYQLNGGSPVLISYSDTIRRNQAIRVQLPSIVFNKGINDLIIFVNQVNGLTDQYSLNDSISNPIIGFIPSKVVDFTFKTDDYGSELTFSILDSLGNTVLYSNTGYGDINGGQIFDYDYCLTSGCYNLKLDDIANDGYCCTYGIGFTLITLGSDTLLFDNTFSTGSKIISFCVSDTLSNVSERSINHSIEAYPNPTKAQIFIESNKNIIIKKVNLLNLNGQSVLNQEGQVKSINIKDLQNGIYFLKVETNQGIAIKKVVKQ